MPWLSNTNLRCTLARLGLRVAMAWSCSQSLLGYIGLRAHGERACIPCAFMACHVSLKEACWAQPRITTRPVFVRPSFQRTNPDLCVVCLCVVWAGLRVHTRCHRLT
eukprot:365255-Chlamydomonas_euryale.AAC.40